MSTSRQNTGGKQESALGMVKRFFDEYAIIYGIFAIIIIVAVATSIMLGDITIFLSVNNFMNVLRQVSMIAIMAAGMYFVIVSGGVDISVGATVGLMNVLFAGFMVWFGYHPVVSALVCILIAALIGMLNGILVAYFSIAPLIATLGMQSLIRGLIFVITSAYAVIGLPRSINWIGNGFILRYIPIPVIIMLAIYIIVNFVSVRTKFGRSVYAVGGNIEAAYLAGINEKWTRISCYMIANVMAAISALILTARLASGQPNSGTGWEFEAIIATVIGGVSIVGGKGKAFGVLFGALLLGLFTNGMTLMNINSYFQQMIKGVILIGAIGLDVYTVRRKARV